MSKILIFFHYKILCGIVINIDILSETRIKLHIKYIVNVINRFFFNLFIENILMIGF